MKKDRRRKLLQFLEDEKPAWKDSDHPELARGSAAWVRKVRREGEKRIRNAALEIIRDLR